MSRITGYYRPVQNWNDGKVQEFRTGQGVPGGKTPGWRAAALCDRDAATEPAAGTAQHRRRGEDGLFLFTTKTCPNCSIAKRELEKAGIALWVMDVNEVQRLLCGGCEVSLYLLSVIREEHLWISHFEIIIVGGGPVGSPPPSTPARAGKSFCCWNAAGMRRRTLGLAGEIVWPASPSALCATEPLRRTGCGSGRRRQHRPAGCAVSGRHLPPCDGDPPAVGLPGGSHSGGAGGDRQPHAAAVHRGGGPGSRRWVCCRRAGWPWSLGVPVDEAGFIAAGEDCLTPIPGIFAAGDLRAKEVRQLTTACADGAVAALAACRFCV